MPATTTRSRTTSPDRVQAVSRPQNDAYTILLLISLLATIAGCLMLYMDYSKYGDAKPPTPPTASPLKAMLSDEGGVAAAGQPAR